MRYGAAALAGLVAVASLGLYGCKSLLHSDSYEAVPQTPPPVVEPMPDSDLPPIEEVTESGFPIAVVKFIDLETGMAFALGTIICVGGEYRAIEGECMGGRMVNANSPKEQWYVIEGAARLLYAEMYDGDIDEVKLTGKYTEDGQIFRIKRMLVGDREVEFPSYGKDSLDDQPGTNRT
jgi:hypothetical protein